MVVRHAEAGDKRTWRGADQERPLSPLGHQQASGLGSSLSWLRDPLLVSSPFARCRQTLGPLALESHAEIRTDPRLAPHANGRDLDPRDAWFDNAVLCTHGETIRAMFRHWLKHGLVSLPVGRGDVRTNMTAKGGAWVFSRQPDGLIGQYRAPVVVGSFLGSDEL